MHLVCLSEWNANITDNLLQGAYDTLIENGAKEENIIVKRVPGTYELSLASQLMFENTSVDSVVAIGSVIQGETKHFDFVCEAVSQGIKDVNLKYNKPAIFCVLTDNTLQQAIDRSGGLHGNKGVECAVAAIKMVALKNELKG
jgi:6,7-dimethyl-8-ribityllumazine synthase